jgi:hypothetical protein
VDYGTIQVEDLTFIYRQLFILFSDYVNQYLATYKKLEQDWVLTVLPVS